MKARHLIVLTIVAVVMVFLAIKTSNNNKAAPPDTIGAVLLPGLNVNDVAGITVRTAGESVNITRDEERWTCREMHGYPADFNKVKQAILKLEALTIGQTVSVTDAERSQLGMIVPPADGTIASGSGTLVELNGAQGNVLAALLIGSSHERPAPAGSGIGVGYPDGKYVSADGGDTVYLVSDLLSEISESALQWIDPELLNVRSDDVQDVTITSTNGQSIALSREEGSLRLPDLAEDEEMDTSKLYGIEGALSYLRTEGIVDPSLADAELGMDKPATFVLQDKEGLVYTLQLGGSPPDSEQRYLRISVDLVPQESGTPEVNAPDDPAAQADADKEARAAKQREVEELNAKLANWTYLVSSYKAEGMLRGRNDLVKKKEDKQDEGSEADG